ncbi:hypothetical protein HKX48_003942 [Thoreauomyces humboldtii]|nr:hypothetical protein HKX48_003942 [Thoreauomyces humboldtii]
MLGASSLTAYEAQRQARIAANKALLADLGIEAHPKLAPEPTILKTSSKKRKTSVVPPNKDVPETKTAQDGRASDTERADATEGSLRRSRRIRKAVALPGVLEQDDDEDSKPAKAARGRAPASSSQARGSKLVRPNQFGEILGVECGRTWETRMACSRDGIHRPPVSGIHGSPDGCYSVALSGGYEDDVDLGEAFTYTGEGGRDLAGTKAAPKNLRTAPQSKNQTLTRGNLALHQSSITGVPVRVVRGFKLNSPYAPIEGYRYDGLYSVKKAWSETGMAGFLVWKFALTRCPGQPPLGLRSEEGADEDASEEDGSE